MLSTRDRESERLTEPDLAMQLERGSLVYFPVCPFTLPGVEDLNFLRQCRLDHFHKNITLNPHTRRVAGQMPMPVEDRMRLCRVLVHFATCASQWLSLLLPGYASSARPDRVTFRPEEEATRRLRFNARNDLLHVDAFPTRPSGGDRILRLFVNVNPTDDRVWVTSLAFPELFRRFAHELGVWRDPQVRPAVKRTFLQIFAPYAGITWNYDRFMLRFHHFLKANETFQERTPKRYWRFASGSAWLAFTDTISHAVLRGQFALEHSFFISHRALLLPDESPYSIFKKAHSSHQSRPAA